MTRYHTKTLETDGGIWEYVRMEINHTGASTMSTLSDFASRTQSPYHMIAQCYDVDCDGPSVCYFDMAKPQPYFRESNYACVDYISRRAFDTKVAPELSPGGCDSWISDGYVSDRYDFKR